MRNSAILAITILVGAVCCRQADGQAAPAAIIEIDLENVVEYQTDISDVPKFATSPNVTPSAGVKESTPVVAFGDIVSVNGQPARGVYVSRPVAILITPTPAPGRAIADTAHASLRSHTFEILKSDGTPVGTMMSTGLDGGLPPPGAHTYPFDTRGDYAIVGGTGAFLGVRGELVQRAQALEPNPPRAASVSEDPANRRTNGGGRIQYFLHIIPMSRPAVATTPNGSAVFHVDFSPVNAAKPAHAGEILIVQATGMGPTVPSVDAGQPFPMDDFAVVNSPVDVSINGHPAQVINAIGWPGLVDTYRIDFQVPAEAATGTAAMQLSAAWIPGVPVSLMVQ
jgi:hypothetical protein